MAGYIDESILQDILARTNIVEVISECMPLKRAGRNFKACCPFHQEKTPSFVVSLDKQIYHCFGCGAGGNVFNFLMQYERLEFPEVVEQLAKKCGVALPVKQSRDPGKDSLISALHKINECAAQFYSTNLLSQGGLHARTYLQKRGLTAETARIFKLGFAADTWDALIQHARKNGVSLGILEKGGLAVPKDGGGFYDRFRNRVIFPIHDIKSSCIGFGARVLDTSLPKYINSPETALYKKGNNLYGLNHAKEAIKTNDQVVVVEGYLDCIIPYQHGVRNIVASLGTALTPEQARLIKRYTNNVVMIYDPDKAGEIATLRSLDIFVEESMQVRVAKLPVGADPDLFVRTHGGPALQALIDKADNLFDYKIRVLKNRFSASQIEGKAAICSEMLPTINKFKNEILKSEYLKRLAEELQLDESAVINELAKIKAAPSFQGFPAAFAKTHIFAHPTEKLLMKLMLEETDLIAAIKEKIEPSDFQDSMIAKVVSTMFDFVSRGEDFQANMLIQHLGEPSLSQLVCESTFTPELALPDKERIVDDCIARLKKNSMHLKRKRLQEAIKKAETQGDEDTVHQLKIEFNYLIKKG